jgi:hypothetical protein
LKIDSCAYSLSSVSAFSAPNLHIIYQIATLWPEFFKKSHQSPKNCLFLAALSNNSLILQMIEWFTPLGQRHD